MDDEPTTQSKKKPEYCRLCGNHYTSRYKFNLISKGVKHDWAVGFEELTETEVTGDDEENAVCSTCKSKLLTYRRHQEHLQKISDEVKSLFALRSHKLAVSAQHQAAGLKRCAESTSAQSPEARQKKSREEKPTASSPALVGTLFKVPTCIGQVSTIYNIFLLCFDIAEPM